MAIITAAEVKALLRISDTTYDTYLAAVIPPVQDFVMGFCNNRFHVKNVYITASSIACVKGDPDTITDSNSNFVEAYFAAGMDIDIQDTINNNSVKVLATVAAGTLTLTSTNELIDEDAGITTVTITRIKFPDGIKIPVANLIKYLLQSMSMDTGEKDVKSVSLGSFSESYSGGFESSYFPDYLLKQFTPWKRIGMV